MSSVPMILNNIFTFANRGLEASQVKRAAPKETMTMITDLGNLSINDVEKLHNMGVEFNVHAGKVKGIKINLKGAV